MFKYPGVPTARASAHELADFAEWMAWRDGSVSATALSRALERVGENDYSDGVPEEDEADQDAEGAYVEIEARDHACGMDASYPFSIGNRGKTLAWHSEELNCRQLVYLYLLLATRLNMRDNRVHAEIDGARLFEKLCAGVAISYLGKRAESMVFGATSGSGGFPARIARLCHQLGEGGGVRDDVSPRVKDGKLDVVAWKSFADSWQGKLIIFGQCKTGTDYRDMPTQLQPDAFCANPTLFAPNGCGSSPRSCLCAPFLFLRRCPGRALCRSANGTTVPLTLGFSSTVAVLLISAMASRKTSWRK